VTREAYDAVVLDIMLPQRSGYEVCRSTGHCGQASGAASRGLSLDPAAHRCARGGEEIVLTAREFAVLEFLMHTAEPSSPRHLWPSNNAVWPTWPPASPLASRYSSLWS
jgi:DNA-binding response OmpR family regulator